MTRNEFEIVSETMDAEKPIKFRNISYSSAAAKCIENGDCQIIFAFIHNELTYTSISDEFPYRM